MAGTNTWSKSTIKGDMNAVWLTCVRGSDKPDLILSTNDFYAAYWEGKQDLERYNDPTPSTKATSLAPALKFATADVVHDSNSNFSATGERMYFLNTEYLALVAHRQANWSQLDDKVPTNQDAVLIPIIFQGQLTCSNRARQGILIDATS